MRRITFKVLTKRPKPTKFELFYNLVTHDREATEGSITKLELFNQIM